jgi:RNA polymerase sigma-70 factor (ECF subfamily)
MISTTEIDSQTLESLFHTYYEGLCRYSFTIVKEQAEAEDVIQGLFIKLWEKRKDLDVLNNTKAYLYRSAHNESLNAIKRINRRAMGSGEKQLQLSETNDASSIMIGTELQLQIDNALETLPEKCQEVFRLSRFEQLSYKEIAAQLSISVKTVENHMGKALRLMREGLEDYLPLILITILVSKGW